MRYLFIFVFLQTLFSSYLSALFASSLLWILGRQSGLGCYRGLPHCFICFVRQIKYNFSCTIYDLYVNRATHHFYSLEVILNFFSVLLLLMLKHFLCFSLTTVARVYIVYIAKSIYCVFRVYIRPRSCIKSVEGLERTKGWPRAGLRKKREPTALNAHLPRNNRSILRVIHRWVMPPRPQYVHLPRLP